MISIVMPTSFDPGLLDRLAGLNDRYAANEIAVRELYGSLPRNRAGSGRPGRSLPRTDVHDLEAHVRAAAGRGFSFTYLVNSSCTGNREFDPAARRRLADELAWIRDAGCRAIVVASPYLIDLARRYAPELRIHVSSIAFAKSTKEARHYLDRGASRLVLDPDTVRDFAFLRRLRRECPDLELEALANHPCLLHCPYETYCYNSVSHASTSEESAPYESYSLLACHLDKLARPVEFVKGSWFRPQDAIHYERAGVTAIKLAGRGRGTDWLARTAETYLSRRFDGDMMELVWEAQWTAVWRSTGRSAPPPFPVRVDASAFDGFLDRFVEKDPGCRSGCGSCRHCDAFAGRALAFDPAELERRRDELRTAFEGLTG